MESIGYSLIPVDVLVGSASFQVVCRISALFCPVPGIFSPIITMISPIFGLKFRLFAGIGILYRVFSEYCCFMVLR